MNHTSCSDATNDVARSDHICSSNQPLKGPLPWLPTIAPLPTKTNFPEFIHIAKNGGGTIGQVKFSDNTGVGGGFNHGWSRFSARKDEPKKSCHDNQTPPRSAHSYHGQTTFCVVRHPLAHLMSAVNFAYRGYQPNKEQLNKDLYVIANNLHEEQVREMDPSFWPTSYNSSVGFSSSVMAIQGKNQMNSQMKANHCHLLPQSDYIWNENGERTCNYVLRFEHLKAEFTALADLYGKNSFDQESGVHVLDMHKQHTDHASKFTVADMEPGLVEIFTKLYAADFCLLGYPSNPNDPVSPLMSGSDAMSQAFVECAQEAHHHKQ